MSRTDNKRANIRRGGYDMGKGYYGALATTTATATRTSKNNNRFITQNNNFARASRFFVHFFTVLARLRRENA